MDKISLTKEKDFVGMQFESNQAATAFEEWWDNEGEQTFYQAQEDYGC